MEATLKYWVALWRLNRGFLLPYLVFFAAGGFALLALGKGEEILYLNAHRNRILDQFFMTLTLLGEDYPYYLACLAFLFVSYGRTIFFALNGFTVMLVSFLSKSFFSATRPFTWFQQNQMLDRLQFIDGVQLAKANTSFPSGHTMAAFAFFTFLALVEFRTDYRRYYCLAAAILVGFSRIYLVQHFLEDVLAGAAFGSLIALLTYGAYKRYHGRYRWMAGRLRPQAS